MGCACFCLSLLVLAACLYFLFFRLALPCFALLGRFALRAPFLRLGVITSPPMIALFGFVSLV